MRTNAKGLLKGFISLLAMASLAGCVVQSLNRFYTDESRTSLPAISGEWLPVDKDAKKEKKTKPAPWKFTEDKIVALDEKNVASNIKAVYFKAGENFFVDCSTGDIDSERNSSINIYWLLCVRGVHTVCRVDLSGEELSLTPIDPERLQNMIKDGECNLKFVLQDGDKNEPLYVSSPEEWTGFLAKHGSDSKLFKGDSALSFKKSK